jgi:hypothetical protein
MKSWKGAGLALAVCACVGVAGWGCLAALQGTAPTGADSTSSKSADARTPVLRIAALPTSATGKPQPIAFDADIARRAVRDGTLRVALPDGTTYPVRIERQYTDDTGHWNVVGRVETPLGPQPMVLTFGADAVFGTLPKPDGYSLRITTGPGGKIAIAPAGGLVPEGMPGLETRSDVIHPPKERVALQPNASPVRIASGAKAERVQTSTTPSIANTLVPSPLAPSQAGVDTTPVQIEVFAAYAPDQVTLRGSVSAVETEYANLFAITNQAHIDSGSRVRLHAARVQQWNVSTTDANETLLWDIGFDPIDGVFGEDLRDTWGADLLTVLRPHHDNDWTCGIAFMTAFPQYRTQTYAQFGYSVVNVDGPCGPLVFAHELGHNLGSMHDRETSTGLDGISDHGAYVFSFGYRNSAFATVMAYTQGEPWVAYFSNPASTRCGAPCGVLDDADNVRSLNLMAPAIAAFRGTPGTLSIADVEVTEPQYQPVWLNVPIRLTGKAPAGGIALQVQVTGGTATQGGDFDFPSATSVVIPEGARSGDLSVRILPDAVAEPDETLQLHVIAPAGVTVADADAVVTLVSVQRMPLAGRLWFPADMAAPTTPVLLHMENHDGPGTYGEIVTVPPDFAYSVAVPYGAQVRMSPQLPGPFVMWPFMINEARQGRTWHLFARKGVRVSGTVRAAPGMVLPPEGAFNLTLSQVKGYDRQIEGVNVEAPDYAFSRYVFPGTNVMIAYEAPLEVAGNPAPFKPYWVTDWDIRQDTTHDIMLSSLPTLRAWAETRNAQVVGGVPVALSGSAPAGGVTFRCRTVDGTAKAGEDYVAMSAYVTIPEGQSGFAYCGDLTILPDTKRERDEYFEIVLDQVSGAVLATPRARITTPAAPMYTGGPQRATKK